MDQLKSDDVISNWADYDPGTFRGIQIVDRVGLKEWLYRIASELHDGPDAHLEVPLKTWADENTKPDEPPAEEVPIVVNPNPQPFGGQPHSLPEVTSAVPPESVLPFTPGQIEALKQALGLK